MRAFHVYVSGRFPALALLLAQAAFAQLAPRVTVTPASVLVWPGDTPTLTALVDGGGPFTYEWSDPLPTKVLLGDGPAVTLPPAFHGSSGDAANTYGPLFQVDVTGPSGARAQAFVSVRVLPVTAQLEPLVSGIGIRYQPPAGFGDPGSGPAPAGSRAVLDASVAGRGPMSIQWYRDGVPLPEAIEPEFSFPNLQPADSGTYHAVFKNAHGSAATGPYRLDVISTGFAPEVEVFPGVTQRIIVGNSFRFWVDARGEGPLQYQWYHDGQAIPAATSAEYRVEGATAAAVGSYHCVVSNRFGSRSTLSQFVNVLGGGRLINVSVRTTLKPGGAPLIVGFVSGRGITGAFDQGVLLRSMGPSLVRFPELKPLVDPTLRLFAGQTSRRFNDDWAGDASLETMAEQVGAFPFASSTSKDASILTFISPRDYTMHLYAAPGVTQPGVVLAEVYDVSSTVLGTQESPRLINVSARNWVGTGENVLIAGFVVASAPTRLLIRGAGPGLRSVGVTAPVLADPVLELHSTEKLLFSNDDWAPELRQLMKACGAFEFSAGSTDSALEVTLPPGAYTAVMRGKNDTVGEGLIEVYEAP
jgi:hypothetical protein